MFKKDNSSLYIPDSRSVDAAFASTEYLGIGAHQDDLEILAFHGISIGYDSKTPSFGGIVCTNGAKSPRSGRFASTSDSEMQKIRASEQKAAAEKGRYSFIAQLAWPSDEINGSEQEQLTEELYNTISAAAPAVIYTHNPTDRHKTHVSVSMAVIEAVRQISVNIRPELYGCEVWGSLDWLPDRYRTALDVTREDNLGTELLSFFESQIAGGKRYDIATTGRRRANATYNESHETDSSRELIIAMNLNELISNPYISVSAFVNECIDTFREQINRNLIKN